MVLRPSHLFSLGQSQLAWLRANWMYGGLITALVLIAVAPVVLTGASLALVLVYLQLPAYMLHQVEEHAGDRFRRFFNTTMGHGAEVLTRQAVLIINVPVVWGLYLSSLYLTKFVSTGLGLIGTYAMLINAVTHVVATLVKRETNPGLWTALGLFVPLSIASLWAIQGAGANLGDHLLGLAMGAGVHAAILAHVRRQLAAPAGHPA